MKTRMIAVLCTFLTVLGSNLFAWAIPFPTTLISSTAVTQTGPVCSVINFKWADPEENGVADTDGFERYEFIDQGNGQKSLKVESWISYQCDGLQPAYHCEICWAGRILKDIDPGPGEYWQEIPVSVHVFQPSVEFTKGHCGIWNTYVHNIITAPLNPGRYRLEVRYGHRNNGYNCDIRWGHYIGFIIGS
jgi:hypothetical protein